ncbi:hypothetical protein [Sinomonas sp. P10A9]|uniref:Uncharacterized protein n=1 Tax=Sinomonas puerhi TaxID=3238584 RepID=A0AB39L104_9MICC
MTSTGDAVRPTFRVLVDLGIAVPQLDVALPSVDHPLVEKAQTVPAQCSADPPEKIRAIEDAHWYKVKAGQYRGGVTELATTPDEMPARWWLGLAGLRQADSPQRNFYDNLPADSVSRFPVDKDWRRFEAELALAAVDASRRTVRKAAYISLTQGAVACFKLGTSMEVRARIRAEENGDAYLSLGGCGIYDPMHFALILGAFPGISSDDWMFEPSEVLGLELEPGEIMYSTIFPPELQHALFEEFGDDD